MLDKLSKKILQYMNEQPQPSDVYYNFDEDLDEVAEAVASDSESVRSAVRYLHERKLIKFAYYNDSDIAACFYLDHNGLHYKEFNQLEAKERWKERLYGFVSGILVSVLASLIISLLS